MALLTDLRIVFDSAGEADLVGLAGAVEPVSGRDNLVQALSLRLLSDRGVLTALGHPRYGSRLRDLVGEPLDRANLELLRRHAQRALRDDPRVAALGEVTAQARPSEPGVVDLIATVTPIDDAPVTLTVPLNLG